MCTKSLCNVIVIVCCFSLIGCAVKRASLKTYVDPSIDPASVQAVAIFPMRNVRLLPDEARELNRGISQAFHTQNPSVTVVGPAESVDLLNDAELADAYSDFLRNYALSGIPNASTLKKIGSALKVDAILQGEVFDIKQIDGTYGGDKGETSLTVRYVILSTTVGDVLWEATSNAKLKTATTLEDAPPLCEAVLVAQEKILSALPTLGE